jgi:hypothetical protein
MAGGMELADVLRAGVTGIAPGLFVGCCVGIVPMVGDDGVFIVGDDGVFMVGDDGVPMVGDEGVFMVGDEGVPMVGEDGVPMVGEDGVLGERAGPDVGEPPVLLDGASVGLPRDRAGGTVVLFEDEAGGDVGLAKAVKAKQASVKRLQ